MIQQIKAISRILIIVTVTVILFTIGVLFAGRLAYLDGSGYYSQSGAEYAEVYSNIERAMNKMNTMLLENGHPKEILIYNTKSLDEFHKMSIDRIMTGDLSIGMLSSNIMLSYFSFAPRMGEDSAAVSSSREDDCIIVINPEYIEDIKVINQRNKSEGAKMVNKNILHETGHCIDNLTSLSIKTKLNIRLAEEFADAWATLYSHNNNIEIANIEESMRWIPKKDLHYNPILANLARYISETREYTNSDINHIINKTILPAAEYLRVNKYHPVNDFKYKSGDKVISASSIIKLIIDINTKNTDRG